MPHTLAQSRPLRAIVSDSACDRRTATINCKIKRENMEEIYLEGPLGNTDILIINSYPSKLVKGRETSASELQKSKRLKVRTSKRPNL
jgi:hypothetical protein